MRLNDLIRKQRLADLHCEGEARALGKAIFTEWRDRYVALLCSALRILHQCRERNIPSNLPHSVEWINAAVHVLTVAPLDVQDYFLRADSSLKNKIIAAVLDDGGISADNGYFVELPPL